MAESKSHNSVAHLLPRIFSIGSEPLGYCKIDVSARGYEYCELRGERRLTSLSGRGNIAGEERENVRNIHRGSSMKTTVVWIVLGLLLLSVFALTFMKSPEAITGMLRGVSTDVKSYSILVHILFLVVIGIGLLVGRSRNTLFTFFVAFLSLSATVIAVKYLIVPNIILFAMFSVLIIHAYLTRNLNFPLSDIPSVDLLFGILGLVFGFWYLHWVESPIWFNALLYSPLGAVNCPTMVTICGFLCLSREPRSAVMEAAVALATLYFGFFGLFRLGAFVDIALILCALFLIVRLTSSLTRDAVLRGGLPQAESSSMRSKGNGIRQRKIW
jgi:hypothetical protein